MWFLKFLVYFMFGSVAGFFIEFVYRSVKNKKFINPGFLNGCCLPIYGFGAAICQLIYAIPITFTEVYFLKLLIRGAITAVFATIFELVGGFVMEKAMHTRLWDYSREKLNFKGYICLKFSIYWLILAMVYDFAIAGVFSRAASYIIGAPVLSLLLGVTYGIFAVDLSTTMRLGVKIREYSVKIKQVVNFDRLKEQAKIFSKERLGKRGWIHFLFRGSVNRFINESEKLPLDGEKRAETAPLNELNVSGESLPENGSDKGSENGSDKGTEN